MPDQLLQSSNMLTVVVTAA